MKTPPAKPLRAVSTRRERNHRVHVIVTRTDSQGDSDVSADLSLGFWAVLRKTFVVNSSQGKGLEISVLILLSSGLVISVPFYYNFALKAAGSKQ